jgi:hypothetical protein
MNNKEENIPEINIKIESKEIKGGIVSVPYIMFETPYMILTDKYGTRKIWTKDKLKIVLYYLYKITRIKWFIKKYNQRPR